MINCLPLLSWSEYDKIWFLNIDRPSIKCIWDLVIQLEKSMCSRTIFSESILILEKNIIFIQENNKAIMDDSFIGTQKIPVKLIQVCNLWTNSYLRFKQWNNSCNFHFLAQERHSITLGHAFPTNVYERKRAGNTTVRSVYFTQS